jgi:hypothetical protein
MLIHEIHERSKIYLGGVSRGIHEAILYMVVLLGNDQTNLLKGRKLPVVCTLGDKTTSHRSLERTQRLISGSCDVWIDIIEQPLKV